MAYINYLKEIFTKIKLSSLCLLLFFLAACCKDDDTVKPDPCANENPVSADFKMEEVLSARGEVRRFEVDTVVERTVVYFTAAEDSAEYEWQVGSDPTIYTTRSFNIMFPQAVGAVDVRLIVKKAPNLACHPNDTGIDTLTKRIFIAPPVDILLKGRYEGFNVSKPDHKFIIEIKMNDPNDVLASGIYNFPEGCPDHIRDGQRGNTAAFIWTNWNSCKLVTGWAYLSANSRDLTIEYKYFQYENNDPNTAKGEWLTDVFKGKRI